MRFCQWIGPNTLKHFTTTMSTNTICDIYAEFSELLLPGNSYYKYIPYYNEKLLEYNVTSSGHDLSEKEILDLTLYILISIHHERTTCRGHDMGLVDANERKVERSIATKALATLKNPVYKIAKIAEINQILSREEIPILDAGHKTKYGYDAGINYSVLTELTEENTEEQYLNIFRLRNLTTRDALLNEVYDYLFSLYYYDKYVITPSAQTCVEPATEEPCTDAPIVSNSQSDLIQVINTYISINQDNRITLLRIPEVIMWLFGDLTYLPDIQKKNKSRDTEQYKILEDAWGQATLRKRRPDLKLDKQWTNKFGEHICEELCWLLTKNVSKPHTINHYSPDIETDDAIFEVKTQTFNTCGTAGEKILGTPFKYAEVPDLYGKKLLIVCMGGAEKLCREQYGNLPGNKSSPQKKVILDAFKSLRIEYVGATDILKSSIAVI